MQDLSIIDAYERPIDAYKRPIDAYERPIDLKLLYDIYEEFRSRSHAIQRGLSLCSIIST